ncbi:MAG: AAA family ATPase [Parachlamydiaceae bacterium]
MQKKVLSEEDPKKLIISAQENLKLIERNKGAKDKFPIQFLNEHNENYFLVEPNRKAMLLEYAKNDGKSAGFLPKGIVAMLVGAGGVGKTHLLAQLAISIATGTPFLDAYTPTKHCGANGQGNIFLGLGENQYDDIHRLLYKATKHLRQKVPTLLDSDSNLFQASKRIAAFSFCGQQASFIENGKPSIYFRELKMRLEDTAPKDGWTLIILDPISRLMGADAETDNAAATQFIALLEELTIDLPGNPTIVFAHHANKSSIQSGTSQNQSAARGASALTDGVRWQCNYTKDANTDTATLKMTKSNFTAIIEEIKTKKDVDGFIERCTHTEEKIKAPTGHKY